MKASAWIAAAAGLCLAGGAGAQTAPAWSGYARSAQHTAQAPARPQPMSKLHWHTPVDLQPDIVDGELLIHYASPMITAADTVIVAVKTGLTGGFRLEAHAGGDGALVWREATDFILPPHDWTPSFPANLAVGERLWFATAGATVTFRDTPDAATGTTGRRAFFGNAEYAANKATYDRSVMISTPITSDSAGNLFFGFVATGATPANLVSGIARLGANGVGTWIAASAAANDATISHVATNSAPALSPDRKTLYVAVSDGSAGYLLGLDSTTLAPTFKTDLIDPSSGARAWVDDDSSAAPTVGPDGDVFYGVLENPFPNHNDRGWLLHFDATLATSKTPGSFGWDATASIVPAKAVPSYAGGSIYLLMSKYNNYIGIGTGDGRNRIAILDPGATEPDPIIGSVTVMKEVETILGPTPSPGGPAGAVYEWCINTAVVDAASHTVIANAEDGHVYRWNLATNTLDEAMLLNPPRPEAYTPTVIGPDGTIYAINNGNLYALGK